MTSQPRLRVHLTMSQVLLLRDITTDQAAFDPGDGRLPSRRLREDLRQITVAFDRVLPTVRLRDVVWPE